MRIRGVLVELVTLIEIAKATGYKAASLREWEEKGWMQPPNFHTKPIVLADGSTRTGYGLYTQEFAAKMIAVIKAHRESQAAGRGGARVKMEDTELIQRLNTIRQDERKKYID
jgi:hypothetical protein